MVKEDSGLSIKELLTKGITEEDLIADLQKQIADAKKEMKQEENKKAAALDQVRHEASTALRKYFIAIGIIDGEDMDDDTWEEAFRQSEKSMMAFATMKKLFAQIDEVMEKESNENCSTQDVKVEIPTIGYSKADKALADFLKTL